MNRAMQVKENVPGILHGRGRKCLYIGANLLRMQLLDELLSWGWVIDIVEIWEKNVRDLRAYNEKAKKFGRVGHGDARHVVVESVNGKYDLVIWWHGPEHVRADELPEVLRGLESVASRIVILGSPWGVYKQGAVGGNFHERHLSYLYPITFKGLGYATNTIGKKDRRGSNLLAWKILKD